MPNNQVVEEVKDKKLFNIDRVEIFSVGTWNGDTYTEQDIDEMVEAYNDTKGDIKPYLKLGHDNDQKLLQNDGLPAAGWISNLRKEGKKLIASFTDIPEKVYNLIKNKAYRKVSSEIYWNIKVNDKKYKKLLSGVALLGSNMPAVTNLSDILELYKLNYEHIKTYALDANAEKEKENKDMSDEKIQALEVEVKTYKDEKEALEQEVKSLKQYKEEQEAKFAQIQAEKEEAELNAFIDGLENDKLSTPAMRPYVKELLSEDKKEYTIKEDKEDAEEKKFSKQDLLKEIIKLFSAVSDVNFDENSAEGEKKDNSEDAIDAEIQKYAQDNKVTYGQAYVAIMNKKQEQE